MVWTFIGKMTITDERHGITAVMHLDADHTRDHKWIHGMLGDRMVGYITTKAKSEEIQQQSNPITHLLERMKYETDVYILKGCIFNKIECNYVDGLELIKEVF